MKNYQKVLVALALMATASSAQAGLTMCGVTVGGTAAGSNGSVSGGGTFNTGNCGNHAVVTGQPVYSSNGYNLPVYQNAVPAWDANPYYRMPNAGTPNVGCGYGRYCSKGLAGRPAGIVNGRMVYGQ